MRTNREILFELGELVNCDSIPRKIEFNDIKECYRSLPIIFNSEVILSINNVPKNLLYYMSLIVEIENITIYVNGNKIPKKYLIEEYGIPPFKMDSIKLEIVEKDFIKLNFQEFIFHKSQLNNLELKITEEETILLPLNKKVSINSFLGKVEGESNEIYKIVNNIEEVGENTIFNTNNFDLAYEIFNNNEHKNVCLFNNCELILEDVINSCNNYFKTVNDEYMILDDMIDECKFVYALSKNSKCSYDDIRLQNVNTEYLLSTKDMKITGEFPKMYIDQITNSGYYFIISDSFSHLQKHFNNYKFENVFFIIDNQIYNLEFMKKNIEYIEPSSVTYRSFKYINGISNVDDIFNSALSYVELIGFDSLDNIFNSNIIVPRSYEVLKALMENDEKLIVESVFNNENTDIDFSSINKISVLELFKTDLSKFQHSIIYTAKNIFTLKHTENTETLLFLHELVNLVDEDINNIFSKEELFLLSLVNKNEIIANFSLKTQIGEMNHFYCHNVNLRESTIIDSNKFFGLKIDTIGQEKSTSNVYNPLFSIIITTYNSAHLISKALYSLNDNVIPFEVIIVDDCSEDNTIEIIEEFKKYSNYKIVIIKNLENIGPGAGRNKALEKVQAPFLTILDADDYLRENSIDKLYNYMKSNMYDMTNFTHIYENESKNTLTSCKQVYKKFGILKDDEKLMLSKNNLYSWGKAYKISMLKTHNIRYSEGIYYEDAIFVIDSFFKSDKIINIEEILLVARVIEKSATRSSFEDGFHIDSYEKAILELATTNSDLLFDGKLEVIKELERRIPLYAKKDIPANYEQNIEKFDNAIRKLYKSWFGVDTYFTKNELGKEVDKTNIFNKKEIIKHSKKVSSIETNYSIAEYFEKIGVEKDTILFLGFDFGYRGNSKYLFNKMLKESKYTLKFVTKDKSIPQRYRVEPYSIEYFLYIAKSVEIYCESYIDAAFYVPRNTKFVQLWHGIPIKKLSMDSREYYVARKNPKCKEKIAQFNKFDEIYYVDEYHKKTMKSAFLIREEKLVQRQYPRVDYLKENNTKILKEFIRFKLGIPQDKKVILYAPTWRDIWMEHPNKTEMLIDFENINIPDEYVVIVQQHPYLNVNNKITNENIICSTKGIETQDLIIASDICISDYSSIIFDFEELDKEIYLLWKDKDDFEYYRGIYEEINNRYANIIYSNELDMFDNIFKG